MLQKDSEDTIRESRFTDEQIVKILQLHEIGLKVAEICRQQGISEQTHFRWKPKYGGNLGPQSMSTTLQELRKQEGSNIISQTE